MWYMPHMIFVAFHKFLDKSDELEMLHSIHWYQTPSLLYVWYVIAICGVCDNSIYSMW